MEQGVQQTWSVEDISIIYFQHFAASATLGFSGVGPGATEHRSSAITLKSRMKVAFNACTPNVPSSLPAFLYSHSKLLEQRRQFVHWSRKSLAHFFSAEWARRSCEAGRCCPEQPKRCFLLLGNGLARSTPVWLYNSFPCSSSGQGRAGCLVQVSAPGWLTETLHLQRNNTSTCIRSCCDVCQAHMGSY